MQRHGSRLTAGLLALALVAGGCGGDDAATDTEPTATSAAPDPEPEPEPEQTTPPADAADSEDAADAADAAEGDTAEQGPDQDADQGEETAGAVYDPESWPLTPHEVFLPSTFVDASGAEVTIETADRIGSMSGKVSEMLWTLGYGDRIVVIDSTTRYPAELSSLPNVGFFRALPAEGILAEVPDVVFVPLDAGPPEVLDAVAEAGVVVVRVPLDAPEPTSLRAMAELIGTALGDVEHATALADGVLGAYDAAAVEPAAGATVVAYAVARGQNVLLTGLDSPSNTIIAAAGFRTVATELDLAEAAPLTPEALVAADPAVIVTTRSSVEQAGGEDAFLAMAGIAETTAGRTGALVVWEDDQSIQQWTPRAPQTVAALIEQITEAAG